MESPAIPFEVQLTLDWTFFGLTPKYKLQKEDQIHDLIFHSKGAFTYSDVMDMPVFIRQFHIKKLSSYFKKQQEEHDKQMRKLKTNNRPRKR